LGDELATANVNRSYSLAATSIAIFTFVLFFLYPRFASGQVNYASSLGSRIDNTERTLYSRRGDRFWLLGYVLLFLAPSLILFSVGLLAVGVVWFLLWLTYVIFLIRFFPSVLTEGPSAS